MTARDYFRESMEFSEVESLLESELADVFERLEIIESKLEAGESNIPNDPDRLTSYSRKTMAKLLYALLTEHGYKLGERKGATNAILINLTERHEVNISRETMARYLDLVNDIHFEKTNKKS